MYLKMALMFIFANISFLNAANFNEFRTVSWDWIAIIILIVLFFVLLVSIIRDLKGNKNRFKTILVQEKCKRYEQNCYLNDINEENMKRTEELGKNIEVLSNATNDKKIIENLKKYQKDIFANTQEEHIFLNIATNREIGVNGVFNISDALSELNNHGLLKRTAVVLVDKIVYPLIGNKKIIQSIIFLLTRLQLRENRIKNPKIEISLDTKKNILKIYIPNSLELNKDIMNVISSNLEPHYSKDDKKYYGVYLYLLNRLADRVNGNLDIETSKENNYSVAVNIPVDFDNKTNSVSLNRTKKLKNRKSALIISNTIELSNKLEGYLKEYNFDTTLELGNELNKDIPNFLNYDIVFMDAELFEPILSDYILSVKKYSDIKIVSLESRDRIYRYKDNLIDSKIDISRLNTELSDTIVKLYIGELVDDDSTKEIVEQSSINKSKSRKTKVLIADDDRTNLHILEFLIKKYGVEVCTAKDGEEALEILDKNRCDLIILDSVMPKLDGFETVKRIRKNEKYNTTPIVIHTSFSLKKNSIETIFKLGFDSYLPKPFNKDELKALLERYIPSLEMNNRESFGDRLENRDDLKEFLAIYSESDKLVERYIKENRNEQVVSILKELKNVSNKIGAFQFAKTIDDIEHSIYSSKAIDSNLIYKLSSNLKELKSNIAKKLQD